VTDGDALLQAILQAPADDAPRLVYADWLDEHAGDAPCPACDGKGWHPGDVGCSHCGATAVGTVGSGRVPNGFAERAEFIRLQCDLACSCRPLSPPDGTGRRSAPLCRACVREQYEPGELARLLARQMELLAGPHHDWIPPPRPFKSAWGRPPGSDTLEIGWVNLEPDTFATVSFAFRRGFVEEVACAGDSFLSHGAAVRARHPVRVVRLTRMPTLDVDEHVQTQRYRMQLRGGTAERWYGREHIIHARPAALGITRDGHLWGPIRALLADQFEGVTFHPPEGSL
jgi:uncharacterized protein (TIGR02996 family)